MQKGIKMGRRPLPIPPLLKGERQENGQGLFSKLLENSPCPFSKP